MQWKIAWRDRNQIFAGWVMPHSIGRYSSTLLTLKLQNSPVFFLRQSPKWRNSILKLFVFNQSSLLTTRAADVILKQTQHRGKFPDDEENGTYPVLAG